MVLPVASQTISKGEIKAIVNPKGDTLVVMHLNDAKKIKVPLLRGFKGSYRIFIQFFHFL